MDDFDRFLEQRVYTVELGARGEGSCSGFVGKQCWSQQFSSNFSQAGHVNFVGLFSDLEDSVSDLEDENGIQGGRILILEAGVENLGFRVTALEAANNTGSCDCCDGQIYCTFGLFENGSRFLPNRKKNRRLWLESFFRGVCKD